jgi:hypothetical protein
MITEETNNQGVKITHKKTHHYLKWVDFEQEEPEKDGVVVFYMPETYGEKYFLMNLSTPCHEAWYEANKKHAKAWFRIPKYLQNIDPKLTK